MAISGMSSAGFHASSQQPVQSLSHHKHGSHGGQSLTDVDAAGSSVASAPSGTGKTGSKIDIRA
ncbi:MAG TPA: hypothetical protein VK749_10780 [Xanthobacteraceae bacterium]|jgi:hypothetical protein|nr:hypothetical protein [Xanthobacteraceae bacterium]